MFKKKIVLVAFLAFIAINAVFSQAVAIDTAISNAAKEISESVPQGTRIAVLNISSDYMNLSDYIINELIVNLVNLRKFQIVPRSTIELEAANMEFDFQMTGNVSDDSQKRLGQFLGAGTIISGTVTRDFANSYRLVINTIDLESFAFQSSFRSSFQDDQQIKTLVAGSNFVLNNDFTIQQKLGTSALNLLFGAGSFAIQNDNIGGGITATLEGLGAISMIGSAILFEAFDAERVRRNAERNGKKMFMVGSDWAYLFYGWLGFYVIGAVYGMIRPLVYNKSNQQISQNNYPFNLELISTNNQDINGVRILYSISF